MNLRIFLLLMGLLSFQVSFAQTSSEPTPAPLPHDALSFCRKQVFAKTCLTTLLSYRCSQYYYPFLPHKSQLCSASAGSMINYMDFKTVQVIEDNKIYRFKIIFSNKLKKLINTPLVQKYLSSLAIDLKRAMTYHQPFDLYNYTLKFAQNRDTAILWLGILFQDTTFSRVQVQYLEDLDASGKLTPIERQIKKRMKEIAIMLEPKNLERENYRAWLKLYPSLNGIDLNAFLNPTFYHFYPIALMATHLKNGFWTKDYAFLVPFALNSDYEFQTLDPENWPWRHPDPFQITAKLEWKMRDIYTGLVASLFGAQKETLTPSYEAFSQRFSANPFKTMREWAYKH
jgi:hypothetical protein